MQEKKVEDSKQVEVKDFGKYVKYLNKKVTGKRKASISPAKLGRKQKYVKRKKPQRWKSALRV